MTIIDLGDGKRIEVDGELDETRVVLPAPPAPNIAECLARAGFKSDESHMRWVRDLDEHTILLAKQALNGFD